MDFTPDLGKQGLVGSGSVWSGAAGSGLVRHGLVWAVFCGDRFTKAILGA
jgi:hypothetical protein